MLRDLISDLRYAARQLVHAPAFALTCGLTLALCVGANLGVFQLLYGVLFAPLPISHPQELYSFEAARSPFDAQTFLSYSAYRNLRHSSQSAAQDAVRIDTQLVSDNFFSVLGLSPAAGRFFLDGDDDSLAPQLPVVVRYGYWKQQLGADPSVIGTRIVLSGIPAVIV